MSDIEERYTGEEIEVEAAAGVVSLTFPLDDDRRATVEFDPQTATKVALSLLGAVEAAIDQRDAILRRKGRP